VVDPELDSAIEIRKIDRWITGHDDRVAFSETLVGVQERRRFCIVHENETCVGW
jgi:hypothetical protein